jgi:predicted ATPase
MDGRRHFGAVLKRFRVAAGLTHEALAERSSLGARTISDLERGVSRAPRADTLALLVGALGLSPEQQAELERAARPGAAPSLAVSDTSDIPGNLAVPLTSFIGREVEVQSIQRSLRQDTVRVVTLIGPGGVGKTRLASQIATSLQSEFTDRVVAVTLVSEVDGEGVVQAIGRALFRDDRHHTFERIAELLAGKDMLLILDNCEHIADAGLRVADLLRAARRLKVLATSRFPLRVSGEREFPVAPLPVPDVTRLLDVSSLSEYAAVALFVDRAMHVRPEFRLTTDNARAVASICTRLDGLPLAVELAAARIKAMSPRLLIERLGDTTAGGSLRLLTGGALDLPQRHQTLRDTIAWSHALLSPAEQILFRRLAVFYGGCTMEAAEAICGQAAANSVLDRLVSLVDKSLLVQEDGPDDESRFAMLETIREYAWERLEAAGEELALCQQHAGYYLMLVESTGGLLFADARKRARAAAEQGNVQAALRWLVQHG